MCKRVIKGTKILSEIKEKVNENKSYFVNWNKCYVVSLFVDLRYHQIDFEIIQ